MPVRVTGRADCKSSVMDCGKRRCRASRIRDHSVDQIDAVVAVDDVRLELQVIESIGNSYTLATEHFSTRAEVVSKNNDLMTAARQSVRQLHCYNLGPAAACFSHMLVIRTLNGDMSLFSPFDRGIGGRGGDPTGATC